MAINLPEFSIAVSIPAGMLGGGYYGGASGGLVGFVAGAGIGLVFGAVAMACGMFLYNLPFMGLIRLIVNFIGEGGIREKAKSLETFDKPTPPPGTVCVTAG